MKKWFMFACIWCAVMGIFIVTVFITKPEFVFGKPELYISGWQVIEQGNDVIVNDVYLDEDGTVHIICTVTAEEPEATPTPVPDAILSPSKNSRY